MHLFYTHTLSNFTETDSHIIYRLYYSILSLSIIKTDSIIITKINSSFHIYTINLLTSTLSNTVNTFAIDSHLNLYHHIYISSIVNNFYRYVYIQTLKKSLKILIQLYLVD